MHSYTGISITGKTGFKFSPNSQIIIIIIVINILIDNRTNTFQKDLFKRVWKWCVPADLRIRAQV